MSTILIITDFHEDHQIRCGFWGLGRNFFPYLCAGHQAPTRHNAICLSSSGWIRHASLAGATNTKPSAAPFVAAAFPTEVSRNAYFQGTRRVRRVRAFGRVKLRLPSSIHIWGFSLPSRLAGAVPAATTIASHSDGIGNVADLSVLSVLCLCHWGIIWRVRWDDTCVWLDSVLITQTEPGHHHRPLQPPFCTVGSQFPACAKYIDNTEIIPNETEYL